MPLRPFGVGVVAAWVGVLVATAPVVGQTFTWAGTSSNFNWSPATNWNPNGPPGAGQTARFDGTGHPTARVNGTFSAGTILVNLPVSSGGVSIERDTMSATSRLVLDNGGADAVIDLQGVNVGFGTDFSVPVQIAGNNRLTVNAGANQDLLFLGDVTGTNSTVTVNAAGQAGRVRMLGAINFGGSVTVRGGVFQTGIASGLPATTALTLDGGVLEVNQNVDASFTRSLGSGAGQVRLVGPAAGFASSSSGLAIRLGGGATPATVTWGGTDFDPLRLVLGAAGSEGSVRFENGLDLGGFFRVVRVNGPVVDSFNGDPVEHALTGVLSGAVGSELIKEGPGTLTLTRANAYAGPTTVTAGALRANSGQGLPAASKLVLNGGVLESIGTATLSRAVGTADGNVQFGSAGGGFAARGGTLTVQFTNGTPVWGAGGFVPGGAALRFGTAASDGLVDVQSGINLNNGTRVIAVAPGRTSGSRARIAGVVSNGGLLVTGGGSLELAGANTYAGATTVTGVGGVLRANDGTGLPTASALTLDGAVLEGIGAGTFTRSVGAAGGQVQFGPDGGGFSASGGTLSVNLGGQATPQTLDWGTILPGGTAPLRFGSGTADAVVDFRNGLTLGADDRTVTVADNPTTPTDLARMSGAISSGGLRKIGPGTLELTGPNTYAAATVVAQGALRAADGVGLPGGSNLVLSGGVFETTGTFTRGLGTGGNQVRFGAAGGGFASAGGTLAVNLGGQATPQTVTFGPGADVPEGNLVFGSATANGVVDFRNPINLGTLNGRVTVLATPGRPGSYARLSGVVSGGSNTLFKDGPGTLELTAANTHGGTVVREGRLVVNNATGSGVGPGLLDVEGGATLGGGGRIALTNQSFFFFFGSRLDPGWGPDNSLAISTTGVFGGGTFNGTWVVRINAAGAGGVAADSGGSTAGTVPEPTNHTYLDLNAGGLADAFSFAEFSEWEIDGTGAGFTPGQRYSYRIGRVGVPGELDGGSLSALEQDRFTTVGFSASDFRVVNVGSDIVLTFTVPVPEPGAVVLVGAAGLGLAAAARRRLRRSPPTAATATTPAGSGTGRTCQARE